MYYVTIEAKTTAGRVNVSSDGARVLDINKHLTGIVVRNGNNCSGIFYFQNLISSVIQNNENKIEC